MMNPDDQDGALDTLRSGIENNEPQPIAVDDVAEVEAFWTDGDDEPEFAWLLRLKDGRWAAGSGGHDYTGWDCQSSLTISVHSSREDAVSQGLTLNLREHLGLLLPGEALSGDPS